jgi:stalled ribosome rescue protein Dom34
MEFKKEKREPIMVFLGTKIKSNEIHQIRNRLLVEIPISGESNIFKDGFITIN